MPVLGADLVLPDLSIPRVFRRSPGGSAPVGLNWLLVLAAVQAEVHRDGKIVRFREYSDLDAPIS